MVTKHLHEFNFVIGSAMKYKLKNLDIYKNMRSLSGVIVNIFMQIAPVIRKEHKWGEQRNSRYMPVSGDSDEKRENVHVYFPQNVYRQLKLMHQDLNFYSIAQLLRGFLEFFLDMEKEYGDGVLQELQKISKQWNNEDKENRLTLCEFIRQLWKIIQHFPGQEKLINIYNKQFSPVWVFLL